MPERTCQRPGCGRAIPSRKRRDARWCSRSCESKARRSAMRKAAFVAANPDAAELLGAEDQSLVDLYERVRDDEHEAQDDEPAAYRPRKWVEDDERFAAIVADDEGTVRSQPPRSAPLDAWRRWRAESKRNPGVEPREQQADRVARQRAARDAQAGRIDAMWPGRVQDRHEPRTAANPGRMGAESRRLNAHYVETPPAWAAGEFDFTNETVDGGPFTRGRPAGQRSRSADYAWNMRDGW
jgi:hypothetical protein